MDHLRVERIQPVRPIDRDGEDVLGNVGEDRLVGHRASYLRGGAKDWFVYGLPVGRWMRMNSFFEA